MVRPESLVNRLAAITAQNVYLLGERAGNGKHQQVEDAVERTHPKVVQQLHVRSAQLLPRVEAVSNRYGNRTPGNLRVVLKYQRSDWLRHKKVGACGLQGV